MEQATTRSRRRTIDQHSKTGWEDIEKIWAFQLTAWLYIKQNKHTFAGLPCVSFSYKLGFLKNTYIDVGTEELSKFLLVGTLGKHCHIIFVDNINLHDVHFI